MLLAVLLYNMVTKVIRFYLYMAPEWAREWLTTWVPGVSDRGRTTQAARDQIFMTMTKDILLATARMAAPVLGAVAACIGRRLRGAALS
jgi:hypothetical protein